MKQNRDDRIKNYVSLLSGFAFKSDYFNSDGKGIQIIRIRDIQNNKTKTWYSGPYDNKYLVKNGDFLIGMDGEFNIVHWTGGPAILNQRVCKLQSFSNSVNPKYIFYFLKIELKKIESSTPFVTVKHVSASKILSLKIVLPPLPEQKRIVEILERVERLKMKQKLIDSLVKQLPGTVFYEMFGDLVRNNKKWPIKKFVEVIKLRRGFDLPKNSRTVGKFPLISSNGITDYVSQFKIKGPGVITGRSGTIGRVQYTTQDYWPLNTALYSENLHGNNVIYLAYFLKLFKLEKFVAGTGVPTLNRNLFHDKLVYCPPIELQNKFAAIVKAIEFQEKHHNESQAHIDVLFNALLAKISNSPFQ